MGIQGIFRNSRDFKRFKIMLGDFKRFSRTLRHYKGFCGSIRDLAIKLLNLKKFFLFLKLS